MVWTIDAVLVVSVNNRFRIAIGVKSMAQLLQLFAQFEIVVYLAVENNPGSPFLVVDGLFGSATAVALKAFQSQRQLLVDGRAGPQTQAALARSVPDHQILEPATTD